MFKIGKLWSFIFIFLAAERNHLILFFRKVVLSKTDWGGGRSGASVEVRKSNRSIIQEHIMVCIFLILIFFNQISGNGNVQAWLVLYVFG